MINAFQTHDEALNYVSLIAKYDEKYEIVAKPFDQLGEATQLACTRIFKERRK